MTTIRVRTASGTNASGVGDRYCAYNGVTWRNSVDNVNCHGYGIVFLDVDCDMVDEIEARLEEDCDVVSYDTSLPAGIDEMKTETASPAANSLRSQLLADMLDYAVSLAAGKQPSYKVFSDFDNAESHAKFLSGTTDAAIALWLDDDIQFIYVRGRKYAPCEG